MMDAKGRLTPRLPHEKENAVRFALRRGLQKLTLLHHRNLRGIAGAASGGDILFHELCLELNIPSVIYLGLPVEKFVQRSVAGSGKSWVKRFEKILHAIPVKEFPPLESTEPSDHWEAVNRWMMNAAIEQGPGNVSVLLLWDEAEGDGGGGTSHMAALARENHLNITVINPHAI